MLASAEAADLDIPPRQKLTAVPALFVNGHIDHELI